jgi:hypothetical protein
MQRSSSSRKAESGLLFLPTSLAFSESGFAAPLCNHPPPSSPAFKELPRSQPAAANVALSPVAPSPAIKSAASEGSVSGPLLTQGQWRRPRPDSDSGGDKHVDAGGDKDVNVQPHVSRRGSILIAQALALKQSHYVLSWQLVFSGSLFPFHILDTVNVV